MYFTIEKLEARTRQLEKFRFVNMADITPMDSMPGEKGVDDVYISVPDFIGDSKLNIGDEFSGRDKYLWIQKTLKLPEHLDGHEVAGVFDFGKTGDGYNSGFEALLYVNGEPFQGVGTYHRDVIFENLAGKEAELTFLLWTGLEGGGEHVTFHHRIKEAHIGYLHKATDEFYYFSKAIFKTLKLLPDSSPEKHELTAILDSAFNLINWDCDKFHSTVDSALALILNYIDKTEKRSAVTVGVVGHTHIDVAWLWRLKHTREKAIRSFSTVLRLMEEFDEYIFLQTQPQLYKYVKTDCPELYEKIKIRIAEKRWEADGGMWVEADCNISSGEALVRQLTHGIDFFKEEFGTTCEYLWLPDVFGYSWALPQILNQCNIKTFMTTKISWNQYNDIPHDLFKWRGIDGSEIVTYFVNTPYSDAKPGAHSSTYNGQISPYSVLGSREKFKDKALSNETLISYGYGDGGGGVNRNMLKMRRAMDKLPGLPNVKPTTARDFFNRIHEILNNTDRYVHTWDGELYLEYHRGTYTSQAHNKKMNRELEYSISQCEWISAQSYLSGTQYPAEQLHDAWECVLLHQFHDIIPGSSIREVYEDSDIAYAKTKSDVDSLTEKALNSLVTQENNSYTLYHAGSFAREDLVLLPIKEDGLFYDENSVMLPAQKTEDGWLINTKLSATSMQTVKFLAGDVKNNAPAFTVDMTKNSLETPLYSINWNSHGQLTSLFDKKQSRQVLAGNANVFEIYEDKPLKFDNWDIDIFYTQKREIAALSGTPKLLECGYLRAVIRFNYIYNRSNITQDMIVYRDSGRIDFVTNVEWHEDNRLLKSAFPVNIRSTKATYDIQFGHVERPTHFNTSWDFARFEVVGHKWADLSETNYGVSLLNNCKYGYSIKDSTMRLTLLKSSKYPDTQADMGTHNFSYALFPHSGQVTEQTIEEGIKFNIPVNFIAGRLKDSGKRLVKIDSNAVNIDAIKKADREDCIVIRVHECRGTTAKLSITSDFSIKSFVECNLLEENLSVINKIDTVKTEIKPFEIKTFKLWF